MSVLPAVSASITMPPKAGQTGRLRSISPWGKWKASLAACPYQRTPASTIRADMFQGAPQVGERSKHEAVGITLLGLVLAVPDHIGFVRPCS